MGGLRKVIAIIETPSALDSGSIDTDLLVIINQNGKEQPMNL
jgi:hypothetical protein